METPPLASAVLPSRSLIRLIHDRNPFYLLSALSMFAGFRIVMGSLNARPGDWRPLLGLIVTMQVYEWLLIGLALLLIRSRGLLRDGWILLGIDALFMADLTNLNAEFFTAMPRMGLAVNVVCLMLTALKIAVVLRVLRIRVTAGTAAYMAMAYAALLALPGVFRFLQSPAAAVSPGRIYAVWWAVSALIVASAWLVRRPTRDHPMAAVPWRLYVLVPLASLLVHLAGENRVYWVHFEPANLAPLLLAVAVVVAVRAGIRPGVAIGVTVVVVALSLTDRAGVLFGHWGPVAVSPMRLAMIASAVTLLLPVAWRYRSIFTATVVTCELAVACVGPSRRIIFSRLWWTGSHLIPETSLQWGSTAIGLAFALLALGAAVSFRRTSPLAASQ